MLSVGFIFLKWIGNKLVSNIIGWLKWNTLFVEKCIFDEITFQGRFGLNHLFGKHAVRHVVLLEFVLFFRIGDYCGLWDWSKNSQQKIMTSHGFQKKWTKGHDYVTKQRRTDEFAVYVWVVTIFCFCGSTGSLGKRRLMTFDFIACEVPRNTRKSGDRKFAKKNQRSKKKMKTIDVKMRFSMLLLELNTRCYFDSTWTNLCWDEWQLEWTPTSITGEFERRAQYHSTAFPLRGLCFWNLSKKHWDFIG